MDRTPLDHCAVYNGAFSPEGAFAIVTPSGRDAENLPSRCDLVTHSTNGFTWGSDEPGTAQLAVAMLADHFRRHANCDPVAEAAAVLLHEQFNHEVLIPLDEDDDWECDSEALALWFCGLLVRQEGEEFMQRMRAIIPDDPRRAAPLLNGVARLLQGAGGLNLESAMELMAEIVEIQDESD